MPDINSRTQTKLDFVLEEVCRSLPNGGDHETRRAVVERLIASASGSNASIEQLRAVAQHALVKITLGDVVRSASPS
ncbi:hypothetical protein ACVWYH_000938 [Bradyrhizobium sp. GM24.11]